MTAETLIALARQRYAATLQELGIAEGLFYGAEYPIPEPEEPEFNGDSIADWQAFQERKYTDWILLTPEQQKEVQRILVRIDIPVGPNYQSRPHVVGRVSE